MFNKATYQYELTQRLSFLRVSATPEELQAARLLLDEIAALGGEGTLESFEVPAYTIEQASMKVTAPFEQDIPCVPYGLSGNLPEDMGALPLHYIEMNSPAGFIGHEDLTGCAALVNNLMDGDMYKQLAQRHAAAIIVINADKWYQDESTTDLPPRNLRPFMLEHGKVPTFVIRSRDAAYMMENGATHVALTLRQTESTATSHNVLATIPGTGKSDECVMVTAHYDSVQVGTGSWDNATGAATIMYIYRHFLANPPARTMRFVWCGSEEKGLLGSKAYVEAHQELLPKVRMCFNFDMCGTLLGNNLVFLTGTDELKTVTEMICNEVGYAAKIRETVHSSDSAPFADNGIPGVGLSRGTSTAEIHTRHDLMPALNAKQLMLNGDFAIHYISRMVNAAVFPVKREISDNMKKELDKYFHRKPAELQKN